MARATKPKVLTPDPAVILDVVLAGRVLVFRLANVGNTPVTAVRVGFSRRIMGMGGQTDIGALPVFNRLEFLAPGRVIEVPVDRAESFFARDSAEMLVATVSYRGADGQMAQAEMRHDLTVWRDLPEIG